MPNPFAYLMLLVWPVIAALLFQHLNREKAFVWSILGAYMLLPPVANFNLPGLPDMDKYTISNLSALVLTIWYLKVRPGIWPDSLVGRVLLLLFVLSPLFTTLTNPEAIRILAGDVPALRIYDSLATISYQVIALIPFFLARRLLASEEGMKIIVTALVTAGLIYSVPMILEARLSPQLNVWVYGFFAHDFAQSIRDGGFRQMVFLPHGLWIAFFALMTSMSALLLMKVSTPETRMRQMFIFIYLLFVLTVSKSTGPTIYAAGLIPLIMFAPRRWQVLLSAVLAIVVITYPLLRGTHLVPLDSILEYARSYSAERGQSLQFRIANEETLLARAAEKPWFGWGGYGRNLILDPVSGRILSIPDGKWIITLGTYGWSGYIAEFGTLILPLLLLAREAWRRGAEALSPYTCVIALLYAANLADMLPNATLIPFTWLMAGALLGHAEALAKQGREPSRREVPVASPVAARRPRSVL